MGATGQPYSDAALDAALGAWKAFPVFTGALDAAHDREALGLDASVHAASYRREVIEEIAAWLSSEVDWEYGPQVGDRLLREFGATETKP